MYKMYRIYTKKSKVQHFIIHLAFSQFNSTLSYDISILRILVQYSRETAQYHENSSPTGSLMRILECYPYKGVIEI